AHMPGNSRTAACTQLSRSRSPSRRSALGAKPEAADLEQGFRPAPKRTSTPPRPAFRHRPTADLAQTDCGVHGAHGAEHHSFTGVTTGAPLPFSNTTTNLAGSVLLALRPTT